MNLVAGTNIEHRTFDCLYNNIGLTPRSSLGTQIQSRIKKGRKIYIREHYTFRIRSKAIKMLSCKNFATFLDYKRKKVISPVKAVRIPSPDPHNIRPTIGNHFE